MADNPRRAPSVEESEVARLATVTTELKELTESHSSVCKELQAAQQSLEKLKGELQKEKQKGIEAEKERAEAEERLAEEKKSFEKLEEELQKEKQKVIEAGKERAEAEERLAEEKKSFEKLEEELQEEKQKVTEARKERAAAEERLAEEKNRSEVEEIRTSKSVGELQKRISELEAKAIAALDRTTPVAEAGANSEMLILQKICSQLAEQISSQQKDIQKIVDGVAELQLVQPQSEAPLPEPKQVELRTLPSGESSEAAHVHRPRMSLAVLQCPPICQTVQDIVKRCCCRTPREGRPETPKTAESMRRPPYVAEVRQRTFVGDSIWRYQTARRSQSSQPSRGLSNALPPSYAPPLFDQFGRRQVNESGSVSALKLSSQTQQVFNSLERRTSKKALRWDIGMDKASILPPQHQAWPRSTIGGGKYG